ncbi:TPA: hypothetical protein ACH3X2_006630 [Trebouxia sp. C0005]
MSLATSINDTFNHKNDVCSIHIAAIGSGACGIWFDAWTLIGSDLYRSDKVLVGGLQGMSGFVFKTSRAQMLASCCNCWMLSCMWGKASCCSFWLLSRVWGKKSNLFVFGNSSSPCFW